jgi:hypothetical protein
MSLIHNERTKLSAICLNTVAAATVVTGVIAPLVAVVLGLPTSGATTALAFALATIVWLLFGLVLHLGARYILGRRQE